MTLNRRQMLVASGAALLLGAGPLARRAFADSGRTRRVLFFTKSAGFEHSVIHRDGDQLGLAERVLIELGRRNGYEMTASKDGRLFDPDAISQWDAFVFMTTGDLTQEGTDQQPPMSPEGKQAFLDAIHAGKGFLGIHCATDTFHSNGDDLDPYIQMIGGEFTSHGAQQVARLLVTDEAFPGVKPLGSSMELRDEWYAQHHLADDLHVIIAHDTADLRGPMYQRPNFPETWARMHGQGRVYYTSMGHRDDVWENPQYQDLLLGALNWITGQADADVTPNVQKATPGYQNTRND